MIESGANTGFAPEERELRPTEKSVDGQLNGGHC